MVTDLKEARRLFPGTADRGYFNTAAVGLASRQLTDTYRETIEFRAADGSTMPAGRRPARAPGPRWPG